MKQNYFLIPIIMAFMFTPLLNAQSKIDVYVRPLESNGYMAWTKTMGETYTVKLYEKHLNKGIVEYKTVFKRVTRDNYIFIPKYLRSKKNIVVEVKGDTRTKDQSNGTGVLDIIRMVPDNPGEIWTEAGEFTCNGISYTGIHPAWEMDLIVNESNSAFKLWPRRAWQGVSEEFDTSIPYYQPMYPSTFQILGFDGDNSQGELASRGYYHEVIAYNDFSVTNGFGQPMHGLVHFVGKKMEEYAPLANIPSSVLAGSMPPSPTLALAINYYNNYVEDDINGLPVNIDCIPSMGVSVGGSSGSSGGENLDNVVFSFDCITDTDLAPDAETLADFLAGDIDCLYIDYDIEFDDWDGISDPGGGVELEHMFIERLDRPGFNSSINPDQIFDGKGVYVAPKFNLQKGLYRLTFKFKDGSITRHVYPYDPKVAPIQRNKDFAEIRISPNPMTEGRLNISVELKRRMNYRIELISSSGETLHKKNYLQTRKAKTVSLNLSSKKMPLNLMQVKITFDDDSEIIKKVLIKP